MTPETNDAIYALKDLITSLAMSYSNYDLGSNKNRGKTEQVISKALDHLKELIP